ncbi:hypothetical protein [Stenotrophomonas sp. PS02289]|uniref:DUF6911 family protein n=1 Tax=Stenotrophomonas sp. PS02289 TaxID=2991422 RepID=UPI00249AEB8C|nr:hypothetical protein [Stenotrophomonas sp. PS02289]
MRISWVDGWGEGAAGGLVSDPDWSFVLDKLQRACLHSGTVTLDIVGTEAVRSAQLQVVAEYGAFWLTLGQDDGEDWVVREYVGGDGDPSCMRTVQGYSVSAASVCKSLVDVINIFKSFFSAGDVSTHLMK